MSRAKVRRRWLAWRRYEDRYIRPPYGLLAVTMPPGGTRAAYRVAGLRWTTRHAINHRKINRAVCRRSALAELAVEVFEA